MYKLPEKFVVSVIGALAILYCSTAMAGECRGLLRPLLLQETPDAGELRAVKDICQVEASRGDWDSEYHLSLFYLGLTNWNVDKAIPLITSAAHNGVSEAQYWLAWQYDTGPLLPDDVVQARQWYERAGENDHRLALQRLADAYQFGDLGLPIDGRKASVLRARAAQCENNSG